MTCLLNKCSQLSLKFFIITSMTIILWWVQNRAPPHRSRDVRTVLIEMFNNHVIEYGHEIEWPPCSPDIKSCDFFLWSHIKNIVYLSLPLSIDILQERKEEEFRNLWDNPEEWQEIWKDRKIYPTC